MNLSFKPQNQLPEDRPVQIILASQSIGRKMLLDKLGVRFKTLITNVNEEVIVDKDPIKTIKRRAEAKAMDVVKNPRMYLLGEEDKYLVIAADSMAILGKATFGKAASKDDAKAMVKKLMGNTHTFVTAVNIVYMENQKVKKTYEAVIKTKVTMRKMKPDEIESYILRYDFSRFAAAYAINELPWDLVTKIDGSYTNVIGLPFETLLPILQKHKLIV